MQLQELFEIQDRTQGRADTKAAEAQDWSTGTAPINTDYEHNKARWKCDRASTRNIHVGPRKKIN